MSAENAPLTYRLLTGPDDHFFCARVSAALDEGYILYGSPSLAFDGGRTIAAQAVIWPAGSIPATGTAGDGGK